MLNVNAKLKYLKGVDPRIFIICLFLLANFKVQFLGDVYISFVVCLFVYGLGFLKISIIDKYCGKVSLYAVVITVLCICHSYVLRYIGFATDVNFQYYELLPIGHYLKLFVFFLTFVVAYEGFRLNYAKYDIFCKSFVVMTVLTMVRYWIEYYDTISLVSTDNLDLGRVYPDWVGGWNSYALILSFAFSIVYYMPYYSSLKRMTMLAMLGVTLVSTQSRGGVWFTLFALIFNSLFFRGFNEEFKFHARHGLILFVLVPIFTLYGDVIYERFILSFITISNVEIELVQSLSSGRSVQWMDAYTKIVDPSSYFQYFVGYGIGHYAWDNAAATEIEVHNMFLQFIYDFGIPLGLLAGYGLISLCAVGPQGHGLDDNYSKLMRAVGVIIVLTSLVEGIVFSTQTGWIVAAFLAMIIGFKRSAKNF